LYEPDIRGYSDVLVTTAERAINSMFLLLAQLFTTKVCADLTWLTSTHNHLQAENQRRRAQTRACLENMQVPKRLSQRVMAYQSYVAEVHREDLSHPLFNGLSANLIQELRLCAYRQLVLKAVFLREQPKEAISLIVGALQDEVYLPADFIITPGARGRDFYFVRRGQVAVFAGTDLPPIWGQSDEVTSYYAGMYFGELAMLTGKPRSAWVMAATYCVCSVMPYITVEELAKAYPSSFTTLVTCMVKAYNLKACTSWSSVCERMQDKYGFETTAEAFRWLCAQGGSEFEEESLTARSFEEGMRRLQIPSLDRKIFWSEMDIDRSGDITLEEFESCIPQGLFDSTEEERCDRLSMFNPSAGRSKRLSARPSLVTTTRPILEGPLVRSCGVDSVAVADGVEATSSNAVPRRMSMPASSPSQGKVAEEVAAERRTPSPYSDEAALSSSPKFNTCPADLCAPWSVDDAVLELALTLSKGEMDRAELQSVLQAIEKSSNNTTDAISQLRTLLDNEKQ